MSKKHKKDLDQNWDMTPEEQREMIARGSSYHEYEDDAKKKGKKGGKKSGEIGESMMSAIISEIRVAADRQESRSLEAGIVPQRPSNELNLEPTKREIRDALSIPDKNDNDPEYDPLDDAPVVSIEFDEGSTIMTMTDGYNCFTINVSNLIPGGPDSDYCEDFAVSRQTFIDIIYSCIETTMPAAVISQNDMNDIYAGKIANWDKNRFMFIEIMEPGTFNIIGCRAYVIDDDFLNELDHLIDYVYSKGISKIFIRTFSDMCYSKAFSFSIPAYNIQSISAKIKDIAGEYDFMNEVFMTDTGTAVRNNRVLNPDDAAIVFDYRDSGRLMPSSIFEDEDNIRLEPDEYDEDEDDDEDDVEDDEFSMKPATTSNPTTPAEIKNPEPSPDGKIYLDVED